MIKKKKKKNEQSGHILHFGQDKTEVCGKRR